MKKIEFSLLCIAALTALPVLADTEKFSSAQVQASQEQRGRIDDRRNAVTVTQPNTVHQAGITKSSTLNNQGATGNEHNVGVKNIDPERDKKTTKVPVGGAGSATHNVGVKGLENRNIQTGLNNRGTFGDERLNNGRSVELSDFRGGNNDFAGKKGDHGQGKKDKDGWTVGRNGDRTWSDGGDNAEIVLHGKNEYGGETHKITHNGGIDVGTFKYDKSGHLRESVIEHSAAPTKVTKYDGNGNVISVTTPRDDDTGGGGNRLLIVKGAKPGSAAAGLLGKAPKGHDDGDGTDPRNETAGQSSGGQMVRIVAAADGKAKEVGTGTVNWNKVLEINETVRPGTN
jgi:hypothetical protein